MSDTPDNSNEHDVSFLQRWSQRKQQHARPDSQLPESTAPPQDIPPEPTPVREEDLPPIESLHENSEVSMFLSDEISETIRRQALRKLFHLGKFNVCDGLDDYADDYTVFQPLRDVLNVKRQILKLTEKLEQAEPDGPDAHTVAASESQQTTDAATLSPTPDNAEPGHDDEDKVS